MKKNALTLLAIMLMAACTNKSAEHETGETYNTTATPVTAPAALKDEAAPKREESQPDNIPASAISEKKTKIIKNASIQFRVKDATVSHQHIAELLKRHSAYFGSDNRTTSAYRLENNMIIRVPATNFDTLTNELMNESIYTDYNNISADDVTDQFVDIEARLHTKKEVEQRYLALLREAKRIPDILDVEEKLRVLREEIESAEGRLKLMNDQVDYSTINLTIYQQLDYVPEPESGYWSKITGAFVSGWRSLGGLVVGLVRIWPFLLLLAALVGFVLRLRSRRKIS